MKASFFGTPVGDQMVDSQRYPDTIKNYLSEEQELLSVISRNFDTIVEVGCMQGRLLKWVAEQRKRYIGIDVEDGYLEAWKALSSESESSLIEFVLGDAQDLKGSLSKLNHPVSPSSTILVFPFNSFGNIMDVRKAVSSLASIGMKFILFSYDTTAYANEVRAEYYRSCGLRAIHKTESDEAVIFSSTEGMKSHAYQSHFLKQCFRQSGVDVTAIPFGKIGVGWSNVAVMP